MPGASIGNTLALLKDKFTDRLVSQTHDRTTLWGQIPTGSAEFNGAQMVGALSVGYPGTGGARGPAASIPVPTQTEIRRHRFFPTFQWHAIQVDYDLEQKSGSGAAGWAKATALQVDRVGMFIKKDLERQAAGNGSAIRGRVSSSSGAVITLTEQYDIVNFDVGMRIDIIDVNNDSAVSQLTGLSSEADYPLVKSVDVANSTVTLSATPTGIANNDYIIGYGTLRLGSGADDTLTNELFGIDAIIGNTAPEFLTNGGLPSERAGTFQGIDPNEDGFWRSQVVTADGTDVLSPGHIQEGIVQVEVFGSGASDQLMKIYTHPLQAMKYARNVTAGATLGTGDTTQSNVRYPTTDGRYPIDGAYNSAKGEKQYVSYAGMPIIPCRYLPLTKAYMCCDDSMKKYILRDIGFWTDPSTGATFHKDFNGGSSFKAELVFMGQIATEVRNSSVLITSLGDPT